jgi:glycerol dehydrogenase-like iron-containing ADH family enzyme
VKNKLKLKWDELQAQAQQQIPQVKRPLLGCLTSEMLLGIIGFLRGGWGSSHKVHGHTLKKMKTLLKQFEQANLLM